MFRLPAPKGGWTEGLSKRQRLVGVARVLISYLAQCPAHLLDDLHVFECRLQGFGGCAHGLYRRLTSRLGCGTRLLTSGPRNLPGFPEALPFSTD